VAAFAPLGAVRQSGLKMSSEKMVGGSIEVKTLFPNNFKGNGEFQGTSTSSSWSYCIIGVVIFRFILFASHLIPPPVYPSIADEVYDPLDMLKLHDLNADVFPHPKWLRESELKHCRIAMLASIGAFTGQYNIVLPGYTAVADPTENLMKFFYEWPLGFAQVMMMQRSKL
jgi:Chlorophyll A-B binding protein